MRWVRREGGGGAPIADKAVMFISGLRRKFATTDSPSSSPSRVTIKQSGAFSSRIHKGAVSESRGSFVAHGRVPVGPSSEETMRAISTWDFARSVAEPA